MKKILGVLILGLMWGGAFYAWAEGETENIGFIPDNIWFSKDPPTEGDTVKIYTLVFNNGKNALFGTVEFYDKNVILGKKEFLSPAGGIKDVSVNWEVMAGDHTLSAKILNPNFILSDGKKKPAQLKQNDTGERLVFVPKKIFPSSTADGGKAGLTETISEKLDEVGEAVSGFPVVKNIESIRINESERLVENKKNLQDNLTAEKNSPDKAELSKGKKNEVSIQRPLKYVKLFFLKLFHFVFSHPVVFYGLLILIIFLILRFIWRRVF